MNDVQVSDLIKLFTEYEENRIQKLSYFAEKVAIAEEDDLSLIRRIGPINGLASQTVAPEPSVD